MISAVIGIGGAAAFAIGAHPALLVGAVLLQASLVLDCVDGEIARSTRTRSVFGAWLDGATDRVKEYAALAGLALAGAHVGQHLWTLAAALGSPVGALAAYLGLAILAQAWALLGAIRRTTPAVGRIRQQGRRRLADLPDDGLLDLLSRGRSPGGVAGWVLPPLVTLLEGAAVVAVTAARAPHWTAAAFGWFAVVAWHRYDVAYWHAPGALPVPAGIGWLGGGWLLRTALPIVPAPPEGCRQPWPPASAGSWWPTFRRACFVESGRST